MSSNETTHRSFSQRQLRVGELVKQNLGELFIRNEAKIPNINSKLITVTEVRMTPDLKTARVYVIPLGGIDTKETVQQKTIKSKCRVEVHPLGSWSLLLCSSLNHVAFALWRGQQQLCVQTP